MEMNKKEVNIKINQADYNTLHVKYCICDSSIVATGSKNFTNHSWSNYENVVLSRNKDMIEEHQEHFNTLWQRTELESVIVPITSCVAKSINPLDEDLVSETLWAYLQKQQRLLDESEERNASFPQVNQ